MNAVLGTSREQLHRRVCGELAQLINTFRLISAGGDCGINKEAENFFCGFLNIVLDSSYPGISLRNMNFFRENYPAIDLGDSNKQIAVQVTTTENREKITHTLEKFFENDLDKIYKRLIILVIGKKDPTKKSFTVQRDFAFDASQDIWDIDQLGNELGKLSEEELEKIVSYFSKKLYTQEITAPGRSGSSGNDENMLSVLGNIRGLLEEIAHNPNRQLKNQRRQTEARGTDMGDIKSRIHEASKVVKEIVEPVVNAYDCRNSGVNSDENFDSLTYLALQKMVHEYGTEEYLFNLAIDIFVEQTADIIESSLVRILDQEIPENPGKSFEHRNIEALFSAYYGLSLIYKKTGNLSALEGLLHERYKTVFKKFPLFYEVQSRCFKRKEKLKEALESDRKSINFLGRTKNCAVQSSYASTVAMMLAKGNRVKREEIDTALQYIDNAIDLNPEYPKYFFIKAQLLFYSHCREKDDLPEFETVCNKAKQLADEAGTKLFELYKGQAVHFDTEVEKYTEFCKKVDRELSKRKKAAAVPKFERMNAEKADRLKNAVLESAVIEKCITPKKPHLKAVDAYIYVCYSPLDYKSVYCDLIQMYQQKIPFVFDDRIKNGGELFQWMEGHISNPKCLGMIFYISKNSLITSSFCEQVKMVSDKKPFLAVNLESDSLPSRIAMDTILEVCEKGAGTYPIAGENLRAFLLAFDDKMEHTVKHKVYTEKGTEHFTHLKKKMIEKFGLKICKEKK